MATGQFEKLTAWNGWYFDENDPTDYGNGVGWIGCIDVNDSRGWGNGMPTENDVAAFSADASPNGENVGGTITAGLILQTGPNYGVNLYGPRLWIGGGQRVLDDYPTPLDWDWSTSTLRLSGRSIYFPFSVGVASPDHVLTTASNLGVAGECDLAAAMGAARADVQGNVQAALTAQGFTSARADRLDHLTADVATSGNVAAAAISINTGIANAKASADLAYLAIASLRAAVDRATGLATVAPVVGLTLAEVLNIVNGPLSEEIVFVPAAGPEVTVRAVVGRSVNQAFPGQGSIGVTTVTVLLARDATYGLTTVGIGTDKLRFTPQPHLPVREFTVAAVRSGAAYFDLDVQ